MNTSWRTYELVMAHVWMRHVKLEKKNPSKAHTRNNRLINGTFVSATSHNWIRNTCVTSHIWCACVLSHVWKRNIEPMTDASQILPKYTHRLVVKRLKVLLESRSIRLCISENWIDSGVEVSALPLEYTPAYSGSCALESHFGPMLGVYLRMEYLFTLLNCYLSYQTHSDQAPAHSDSTSDQFWGYTHSMRVF